MLKRALLGMVVALNLGIAMTETAAAATASNGPIAYMCVSESFDFDICVVDPATGTVRNLTNDAASDSHPSWSPDGSQIAFNSDHSIYVMNANGSGRRHVIGGFSESAFSPAWSPDGSRIAFVSTRGETDYEIWTVPPGGETADSPAVRLTTTPVDRWGRGQHDSMPAWSPDSERIVFVSQNRDALDACDVYAMDATDLDQDGNGDNLLRLTRDNFQNCSPWEDINPSWSPTGDLIAYSSTRTGNADIWVMNPDGSGQRNLTNHPGWDWMPGWSPDGRQVTFTGDRDGDWEIYALALDAAPTPVAGGAASGLRTLSAQTATAEPQPIQLTHNDTEDRMSDWGARPPARPVTKITRPLHGASYLRDEFALIRGTATSENGIAYVDVALREQLTNGDCRWWNGSRFVAGRCGARVWVRASNTGSWSYRLRAQLEDTGDGIQGYTAYSRATDRTGLRTARFQQRLNANTFYID